MLLDPEPHHMVRPLFVGLRGAGFTVVAFLAFFYMTGVTWEQKLAVTRPYLAAVGISFALHYVSAWVALMTKRRQEREGSTDA